jgi:uncharacterized membrane protein YphA (DoxX/SURF4 family)
MQVFPLKNNKWFLITVRLVLGAIFIYASVYKILSPGAFAHQIYNYKILPPYLINPVALTLPWIQLLCGLALVLGRLTKGASLLIFLMMATFQMALLSALIRGLNVSCGCFKSGGSPATWLTFLRDFTFLTLAAVQLFYGEGGKRGTDRSQ